MTIDDKLPFLEKPIPPDSAESCVSRSPRSTAKSGKGGKNLAKDSLEKKVELVPLYPRTSELTELWPALLMKAILKVVALE